ncbi:MULTISPECIES: glycosyltransferase [unclassified Paenibacillus]|uniref:glycosyltransferase n=1 Tax=unclassified Paenibacillus TaxID=185978 RepID=UPI00311999FB
MREKMLFLSAHHHYPEDFEREIRTENYLGILLERFDIDLLEYCHCDWEAPYTAGPALKVHRVTRVPGQRSSLLGSLSKLRSSTILADANKDLRAEITALSRLHTYSHVFITHPLLGNCIDMISSLLPGAMIITDAHRLESRHSEGKAAGKRGLSRRYHQLNAALYRREERKLMNKTALLLTASEWDALSFKALSFADAGKVHVVPPFIDLNDYYDAEPSVKDNSIVLHWNMHTNQGRNAALVFYRKVYPFIKAKVPDCRCYIFSGQTHSEILALAKSDPSVVIIEEPRQEGEYIRRARAVIATLREGCGGHSKILEAWALKTPVVTSLKGSEELICEPGRNILLAGTTGGIADHVVKLLQTPELGAIIADHAYRTLQKHYEADNVRAKVLSLV